MRAKHLLLTFILGFGAKAYTQSLFEKTDNLLISETDSISKLHVPVKKITSGPGYHWFAYYDKLQCDPETKYALGMKTHFEHRSPTDNDSIEIGMVDLHNNNKWIKLGISNAWGWQQGCQLQFIPGSTEEILWNDREGDKIVCHIMNIRTKEKRTIPWSVYALTPDGNWAFTTDYARINDMYPGYGYAGITDPYKEELAPEKSGIWKVNLHTGEASLIISIAQVASIINPYELDFEQAKHYFNHLLVNPDGTRFIFLHRWKYADDEKNKKYEDVGGFGTRMFTASVDGKDLRIIDPYNYTSHFIWKDAKHILAWTRIPEKGDGFFLFEDSQEGKIQIIGQDIMTVNGHCTYLPDSEWILNDTYPHKRTRLQSVFLYNEKQKWKIPLADMYSPIEYKGEWRCDTHPRATPDGKYVIVDSPNIDGRQMYMLDISKLKLK